MNGPASAGAMPEKVSDRARAIVTAGFANEVLAVNQYAATITNATATGTAAGRERSVPRIVSAKENVATLSESHCAGPLRA